MKHWRHPQHAERGASLAIVLILITAGTLLVGTTLSLTDTGSRTGVRLRDQAADVYSADGATNAILNALRTTPGLCAAPTGNNAVTLGTAADPFYVPTGSGQGSLNAYATCSSDEVTDTTTSQPPPVPVPSTSQPAPVTSTGAYAGQGNSTLPYYAVYTTGSTASDFGLDFSQSAGNNLRFFVENGSVVSRKNIVMGGSRCLAVRLASTGNDYNTSCNSPTTGTGVDPVTGSRLVVQATGACSGDFSPTACTPNVSSPPTLVDPGVPGTVVAIDPAPACVTAKDNKKWLVFTPGVYTTASALNGNCGNSPAYGEWLTPGSYFFTFDGLWQWPTRFIAGTLRAGSASLTTGTQLAAASSAPNDAGTSCVDPASTNAAVQGVSMTFGAGSRVGVDSGNNNGAEICASSPAGSPPVALYVAGTSVGAPSASQAPKSAALGGGTLNIPASTIGATTLIDTTPTNNNGHAQLYIRGYVWTPSVTLDLDLKNSIGQIFNWGVVARNLRLTLNGSSPAGSVFRLPSPNTGIGTVVTTTTPAPVVVTSTSTPPAVTQYTVRYIQIWTCPVTALNAAGQCPHNGSPTIQARVQTDPTGKPLKILSWSRSS